MQVFAKRVIKNRPSVTRNSGKSLLPKQGFSVGLADAFSGCRGSGLRRRCCRPASWEEQRTLFVGTSSAGRHVIVVFTVLQARVAGSFLCGDS